MSHSDHNRDASDPRPSLHLSHRHDTHGDGEAEIDPTLGGLPPGSAWRPIHGFEGGMLAPRADPAKLMHELSNLLDGSLRNVSLALRRVSSATRDGQAATVATGDELTVEQLRTANNALHQMAGLLHGWQRGSGAAAEPTNSHTTLAEVVAEVFRLVRPVAEAQRIDLEADLDAIAAESPAGPLQPVLVNGTKNAIEAIEDHGRVTVAACAVGDDLEIRVIDTGPGVHPRLPRDRDGLLPPGTTTKAAGSGLGLAVSRDIVRALGGVIRLENREDARGARLLIRLPLAMDAKTTGEADHD